MSKTLFSLNFKAWDLIKCGMMSTGFRKRNLERISYKIRLIYGTKLSKTRIFYGTRTELNKKIS